MNDFVILKDNNLLIPSNFLIIIKVIFEHLSVLDDLRFYNEFVVSIFTFLLKFGLLRYYRSIILSVSENCKDMFPYVLKTLLRDVGLYGSEGPRVNQIKTILGIESNPSYDYHLDNLSFKSGGNVLHFSAKDPPVFSFTEWMSKYYYNHTNIGCVFGLGQKFNFQNCGRNTLVDIYACCTLCRAFKLVISNSYLGGGEWLGPVSCYGMLGVTFVRCQGVLPLCGYAKHTIGGNAAIKADYLYISERKRVKIVRSENDKFTVIHHRSRLVPVDKNIQLYDLI
jgi:hypothetical protein